MLKRILMAAATLSLVAGGAQATTVGLIGLYQFANGDLLDTSGQGNHGTSVAGVSFVADGKATGDGAARFDAVFGLSGFSVPIDVNASALPEMTFGAWVNVDPSAGILAKVLSHDTGSFDRTLGLDNRDGDGANRFSAFTGSGVLPGTPRANDVWTHIAASYDGTTVTLFVDGAIVGTANDATDNDVGNTSLFVGTNPGFNEDWVGEVDDVFVFNRALSENEIAGIVADGFPTVPLPATLPLMAAGLLAFGLAARRKARA